MWQDPLELRFSVPTTIAFLSLGNMGVSQHYNYPFGVPRIRIIVFWGSVLRSPYLGKLPYACLWGLISLCCSSLLNQQQTVDNDDSHGGLLCSGGVLRSACMLTVAFCSTSHQPTSMARIYALEAEGTLRPSIEFFCWCFADTPWLPLSPTP